MELAHVLAGLGVRAGEPEHERVVEFLARIGMAKLAESGEARLGARRRNAVEGDACCRP